MKTKKTYLLNKLVEINVITAKGNFNPNKSIILEKFGWLTEAILIHTDFLSGVDITINERIYCLIYDICIQPTCKECNKVIRYHPDKKTYNIFCSVKCAKSNVTIKNATKETNLLRYGHKHPMQNSTINTKVSTTKLAFNKATKDLIREKYTKTSIEKYGCDNPAKSKTVKQKQAATNFKKYGCISPSQNSKVAKKISENHSKQLYGNINNSEYLFDRNRNLNLKEISDELHVSHSVVSTRFRDYEIPIIYHANKSTIHTEIVAWLKTVYIDTIDENNRLVLNGKEIDVLLPDINYGIEIDGIYWHSELVGGKGKYYHKNKTIEAKKQGIDLIHIYDIEWMYKREIVQSRILAKIQKANRIFARKCIVKKITSAEGNLFFNANHLQGGCNASYQYGLFYNDTLVSCISFSKSRFSNKYEWELLRYCNKLNHIVVGGVGKLFQHFIRENSPKSIVSYSDLRWGIGNVYKQIGFCMSHISNPNFKYVKAGKLYNRMEFQKHKLERKLTIFSKDLSAWENMVNNGFDRLWDCGNSVWIWDKY